jgi:ubiquinone/menaquinone biosynthesis C-methylase UbiE
VHAQGADLKAMPELAAALLKPPVVLDLACGTGHFSFAVAPVAASVTASDLSPQMLEVVAGAAR